MLLVVAPCSPVKPAVDVPPVFEDVNEDALAPADAPPPAVEKFGALGAEPDLYCWLAIASACVTPMTPADAIPAIPSGDGGGPNCAIAFTIADAVSIAT